MNSLEQNKKSDDDLIRVMVVDDSVVIRNLFTRVLERDPMIKVVNVAANGQLALDAQKVAPVDIVVLDIEMPVMDGITALPQFIAQDPKVKVIMASTLTTRNAQITLEAFQKGAAECLSKPSTGRELATAEDFKRDLLSKVKALGLAVRNARGLKTNASTNAETVQSLETAAVSEYKLKQNVRLFRPKVIAVGSSTGGPQALFEFLKPLKGVEQPIFITQHMPETFTRILATHIHQKTGILCDEAKDGETVVGGRIYLAPGGYHMTVETQGINQIIRLNQEAPEHYCRPSVEPMIRSLMNVYQHEFLTVILTGMGADGNESCEELSNKGGIVIAQDKETSVVWGMPKAVADKGICYEVLPLDKIGQKTRDIATMIR